MTRNSFFNIPPPTGKPVTNWKSRTAVAHESARLKAEAERLECENASYKATIEQLLFDLNATTAELEIADVVIERLELEIEQLQEKEKQR